MSDSREAFLKEIKRLALDAGFSLKKQPDGEMDLNPYVYAFADSVTRSERNRAQAQASKPIAAVHGWFHGECVIRPLDPEAVLPAGMALYSQPQAQAVNQQLPAARVWNQADGRDGKLYAHGWNDCLAAIAAAQEQSK